MGGHEFLTVRRLRRRALETKSYGLPARKKMLSVAGIALSETASGSLPPSGGRPRLVADHTHKEPCTKIARAGACSFLPTSQ